MKRYPVEMGFIVEPTGEDGFTRIVTEIDGEEVVLASDYDAACRERDEEIARLRNRLAEWVARLRWADGLTDVVEQMEEESKR